MYMPPPRYKAAAAAAVLGCVNRFARQRKDPAQGNRRQKHTELWLALCTKGSSALLIGSQRIVSLMAMDATALAHATSSRFILPSSLHSAGTSTDTPAPGADEAPALFPVLGVPEQTSRAGTDNTGRDVASSAMARTTESARAGRSAARRTFLQQAWGAPRRTGDRRLRGSATGTAFRLALAYYSGATRQDAWHALYIMCTTSSRVGHMHVRTGNTCVPT